jgi:hypothetical protein
MVNVIKGKGPNQNQEIKPAVDIESAGFGAKAAIAALSETKTAKSQAQPEAKDTKPSKTESKQSKAARKAAKAQEKSVSDKREEDSRKLIGANRGSITGSQVKSNKQLTQRPASAATTTEVEDAWEDPNEVSRGDDEVTALEKRVARALEEESQIESQIETEVPLADLSEADGLNNASQPIRDYGNYGSLINSPDLLILMNGISESFDQLLNAAGIQMPEAADLNGAQLAEVFARLNLKKKKSLTDEEKEAELILAGAVAILAIPKIKEKLQDMGLKAKDAESVQGILEKLIEEVKQDDHPYHHLYTLIKEETEYSIVPEDPASTAN